LSNKRRFLRLCFLRPGRRVVARTGDRRSLHSGFSFLSCCRSACSTLLRYAHRSGLEFEVRNLLRCRGASFRQSISSPRVGRGGREAGGGCSRFLGVFCEIDFLLRSRTRSRSVRRRKGGSSSDMWWFAASGLGGLLAQVGGSRRFADLDCFSP
ncbi:unnamed protein product, partial [Brassica rapa]